MVDLKLYTKNYNELGGLLKTVKKFNDDINVDKCAKAIFKIGKLVSTCLVGCLS